MISVAEAEAALFDLVRPLGVETIPLDQCAGRILATSQSAKRPQPPFDASAMDGYAVMHKDAVAGAKLRVIGQSAAGRAFADEISQGQALRIFTGGVVPKGADCVVIQENVTADGDWITVNESGDKGDHIRYAGNDFAADFTFAAPKRLTAADIALLAAMNHAKLPVYKQPDVAIISTGDELVFPGQTPAADQIIASNTFGIQAQLRAQGAKPRILPIARDNAQSLGLAFDLAKDADLIITIGGASVGDHDLVATIAADKGLARSFYKVAMRPGKPLMAGKLGNAIMVGLPGNPVSAMVCTEIFLRPMIDAMMGLPTQPRAQRIGKQSTDLPANGPRAHYMRAFVHDDGTVDVFDNQDSAKLRLLTDANALAIRPPNAAATAKGSAIPYILLG